MTSVHVGGSANRSLLSMDLSAGHRSDISSCIGSLWLPWSHDELQYKSKHHKLVAMVKNSASPPPLLTGDLMEFTSITKKAENASTFTWLEKTEG